MQYDDRLVCKVGFDLCLTGASEIACALDQNYFERLTLICLTGALQSDAIFQLLVSTLVDAEEGCLVASDKSLGHLTLESIEG